MIKVPLLSRLSADQRSAWMHALNKQAKGFIVCDPRDLSESEKTAVRVAIVANPDPVDLRDLPALKWVQSLWAGVEDLTGADVNEALQVVRLVDDRLSQIMAESVLAWVMYLQRNMPLYRKQQEAKLWVQHPVKLSSETQVGVLGLGELGHCVAQKLDQVGFSVCGWSRTAKAGVNLPYRHVIGAQGLDEILKWSNVVVVLLPLTTQTRGLLGFENLAKLPRGAALINFARGAIIDNKALLKHLDAEHLAHAVLDVFEHEPLPSQSQFWEHPAVTVLPHIAAPTSKISAAKIVAANLNAYFSTGNLPSTVDRSRGY